MKVENKGAKKKSNRTKKEIVNHETWKAMCICGIVRGSRAKGTLWRDTTGPSGGKGNEYYIQEKGCSSVGVFRNGVIRWLSNQQGRSHVTGLDGTGLVESGTTIIPVRQF